MSEFSRVLPPSPRLEQQKKQARELLRAVAAGDRTALARFRAELPDKARLTLADAQYVLAREYGFGSWAELKRHIDASGSGVPPRLEEEFRRNIEAHDVVRLRALLLEQPAARTLIDAPLFSFDSPALVYLAGGEDVALIDALLEFGADPNRRTSWWAGGFHPLHGASPAIADRLIRAGAVVDACAAAHLDRVDLLGALLDADPARVHERGGDGKTPLHFARSREVADLLLARGAHIDARDVDHRSTPAQWMLEGRRGAGRYELARYLVERGADADVFLAAALGLTERLRALLESDATLVDRRTGQGEYGPQAPSSYHIYFWTIGQNLSPLQVAAQFEQPAALELLRSFASPGQVFMQACQSGDSDEARRLLQARPGLLAELGATGQRALADAAWAGNSPAVRLMLELGFDPAIRGHDGGTALHCAAWEGSGECVEAILRDARGRALVGDRDPHYQGTPLGWCCHGAAHCGNPAADHATVARLLLEAGAAPPADTAELPAAVRAVIREFTR